MDDPIFAAIAEYKRADREAFEADTAFDDARHDSGPNPWRDRTAAANEAYQNACAELAATIPTTIAGAAALVALYVDDDPWEGGEKAWHRPAMQNLTFALGDGSICRQRS